ncbi:MAG: zinc ribbon domain-containing protein [Muribaculaceae bacterium]|nr:zinc ribbon domain-containing protein [Muribaculaceae bacterium]
MQPITCPTCGALSPAGSRFCRKCGTRFYQIECKYCHAMIPGETIFCPNCHQMVRSKQPVMLQQPVQQPRFTWSQKPVQPRPVQQQYGQSTSATPPMPPAVIPPEPQEEPAKSKKTKYYIIGAALALFLILFIVHKCFFATPNNEADATENVIDADHARDILDRTLKQNNLDTDGARIAYALRTQDRDGKAGNKIIGITYLADDNHSFYKLYTITKNDSTGAWDYKLNFTKFFTSRYIVFDPRELRTTDVPLISNIEGKTYFYYAFLCTWQDKGCVSGVLVDVETGNIEAQIDFEGNVAPSPEGQQIEIAKINARNTALHDFIKEHAHNIGYLHLLSPEEIAAIEEENRLKALEDPANAESRWNDENPDVATLLDNDETVTLNVKEYDLNHQYFKTRNFNDRITKRKAGVNYNALMCSNGAVYASDKIEGKVWVVYATYPHATDIKFDDENPDLLIIHTSSGRYKYDLVAKTIQPMPAEFHIPFFDLF